MVNSEIIRGFNGILFIGDLHLSSRRVGRRIDNYAAAILAKLDETVKLAQSRKLFPVFLGDIFNSPEENSLELLSKTQRILQSYGIPPVIVGGSHDRLESWFTDKDALRFVASAGVAQIFDTPGKAVTLEIDGQLVELWVTPAGFQVPDAVPTTPGATGIMVTHHDFDFQGMYPGAHELHEIEGCSLMVNGHMHTPTPMVLRGKTACYNPGSVSRVKIDQKKHQPKVSVWSPAHGINLEGVALTIAPDVFDLTGKEVFAATPQELKASMPKGLRLSSFATKLRTADSMRAARTDDGSVLVESLDGYLTMFDKPAVLKTYLTDLLQQVVAEQHAA